MWDVILILIIIICIRHLIWPNSQRPPGPWGLPIIGYLPWIDPKKPYLTLTNLSKRYGPIYAINLGSVYTVVLSDVKLIRHAFAKEIFTGRAPLYVTHGIMQGNGLICAEGELWKDQRKFTIQCLKNFGMTKFGSKRDKLEATILSGVHELVNLLENYQMKNEDKSLDPREYLRHSVGNVMNTLVFGIRYELNDPEWRWLLDIQEEGCKYMGVTGPLNFIPILRIIPSMRKPLEYIIAGQSKTHSIYHKLIEKHQNNPKTTDHFIDAFIKEREARANEPSVKYFNDAQFVHLLADLFGAGLDTTLSTLRWVLLFVAKHPEVQEKLYNELKPILENRLPSLGDLDSLPYFEATIAETQRIRPVVPVGIPHGSVEPTILNGFDIPKGAMIVPLQWAIHMDPDKWDEPEVFNPDRFLDENGKFFKPECFIPFQTGKRMCVGDDLAKMLLFLFGATIFSKFEVIPDGELDTEGDCGITFSPTDYKVVFKPRV